MLLLLNTVLLLECLVLCLETAYVNSTPRWNFRFDPLDYLWPKFAQLGEQPVYAKEVNGSTSFPDTVFGYQSRYADYKYNHNTVHGDFKTNLDFGIWREKFQIILF